MPKNALRFLLVALGLAWAVDLLFWKQPLGLNFPLWVLLVLTGGIALILTEGRKLHPAGWLLAALALALSLAPLLRAEELTRAVGVMLAVLAVLLLVLTARNGFWLFYRLADWVTGGFELIAAALSRTPGLLRSAPPSLDEEGNPLPQSATPWRRFWRVAWRVLLGLLLAVPVVAVLAGLLSSADPIFQQNLEEFLKLFRLERIPEYIFRTLYVLLFAYLFGGLLLQAVFPRKDAVRPDPAKPSIKGFLGPIETGVILGAVDVLFALFVIVQFRYFFAGQANISLSGFTYSEYAVRGFNELVTVAVLSLMLYQVLGLLNKHETAGHRLSFKILSVLLFGLVLVILASSWLRLGLYENAYGFTRLRTYTHLFIPWLAGLLLVTAVLELLNRRGHFALALWLVSIGFGLTLILVNVDGFIVRQNTARAAAGEEFDFDYLSQLSDDAVPAMLAGFNRSDASALVKDTLGAQLVCRAQAARESTPAPWRGFTLAESQARRILLDPANQAAWSAYPIQVGQSRTEYLVNVNGVLKDCNWFFSGD